MEEKDKAEISPGTERPDAGAPLLVGEREWRELKDLADEIRPGEGGKRLLSTVSLAMFIMAVIALFPLYNMTMRMGSWVLHTAWICLTVAMFLGILLIVMDSRHENDIARLGGCAQGQDPGHRGGAKGLIARQLRSSAPAAPKAFPWKRPRERAPAPLQPSRTTIAIPPPFSHFPPLQRLLAPKNSGFSGTPVFQEFLFLKFSCLPMPTLDSTDANQMDSLRKASTS